MKKSVSSVTVLAVAAPLAIAATVAITCINAWSNYCLGLNASGVPQVNQAIGVATRGQAMPVVRRGKDGVVLQGL